MKYVTVLLCCVLTLGTFAQKSKTTTNRFAGLDTAFARILKQWKAPGLCCSSGGER